MAGEWCKCVLPSVVLSTRHHLLRRILFPIRDFFQEKIGDKRTIFQEFQYKCTQDFKKNSRSSCSEKRSNVSAGGFHPGLHRNLMSGANVLKWTRGFSKTVKRSTPLPDIFSHLLLPLQSHLLLNHLLHPSV